MTHPFADEHARADVAAEGAEPPTEPDEEVVDGLPVVAELRPVVAEVRPVVAEVRPVERVSPAPLPAVQAAAAAATGFVAGAATVALVKRRAARKMVRNGRNVPRRTADLSPIVASRSFLVDVHVIGKQGD